MCTDCELLVSVNVINDPAEVKTQRAWTKVRDKLILWHVLSPSPRRRLISVSDIGGGAGGGHRHHGGTMHSGPPTLTPVDRNKTYFFHELVLNLPAPLDIKWLKCFQLRGAMPSWPPDQGLCPWTPLGALPPDPRYTLVLRTRHGAPPTTDPFRRLWYQTV